MANVDFTLVHKRLARLLNAQPDDGSWAITSTDQGKFTSEEVVAGMFGGQGDVYALIVSSLENGHRNDFCADSAELNNGDEIPSHPGKAGAPQIKLADNSWVPSRLAPSLDALLLWQRNTGLFPASIVEGHYFDFAGKVYFIGQKARYHLPAEYVPDRVTPAFMLQEIFENPILCAAASKLPAKRGMGSELASFYGSQFVSIYAPLISGNSSVFPEVHAFQRSSAG